MLRRLDENTIGHAHKNEENELQTVQNVKNDNVRDVKANAPTKSPARRQINTGLRDRENRQTPTSKSRVLDVQRAALTPTKNTKKPYVFKDPRKSPSQLPAKRKKDEQTKKSLKDDLEDVCLPSSKKLDLGLGPVDESEVEYAPPRSQEEPYQPDFAIDLSSFSNAQDLDVYEWGHTVEADSITRQPKKDKQDEFVDWLFKSLERPSNTSDIVSELSATAQSDIALLPPHDENDVEYAPPQEEELPYHPEFEIDLSSIPKEPAYSVYEFGHLLDKRSGIAILLELEEEEELHRFDQDEFQFEFDTDKTSVNLEEDELIRVPFDDFQFDVTTLSA